MRFARTLVWSWSSLAVIGIACAVPSARADGVHQHAVAAFEHARKLIEAGDCPGALQKLDESIRYEASIGAHLSYADCVEKSDPHLAYRHLRDAHVIAKAKSDSRITVIEERTHSLAPQIAAIQILVDPVDLAADGFVLKVDEVVIDRFHLSGPIAAPPGEHVLSASIPNGKRWTKRVQTLVGRVIGVKVVLEDPPPVVAQPVIAPPPPLPKEEPKPSTTRATIGLVVTSVGVATLLTGGAFGIVTMTKRSELDRVCNGSADHCTGPPRTVDPVLESAERNATMSTIFVSAGGALVVGGLVLWLTAPKGTGTTTALARGGAIAW